jgi:hypothetical protein
MPVEIKELHIRVTVNEPAPSGTGKTGTDSGAAKPGSAGGATADREAIISECVEQMLNVLQNKLER